MKARRIEFRFPLPRTHCGIALGNGMFGALVWGGEKLCITVNRSDFWDHRGGECIQEGSTYEAITRAYESGDSSRVNAVFRRGPLPAGARCSSRLPMGRFELLLRHGTRPERGLLDLETGRLTIETRGPSGPGASLTLALGPKQDVLFIADAEGLIEEIVPRPAWEWVGAALARFRFAPPQMLRGEDECGWAQTCPDDPAMAALARRIPGGIALAMLPGADAPAAFDAARRAVARLEPDGAQAFLAEHDAWWRAFWARQPQIDLPDDFYNTFFDYALYKFAGATNPHSARPCALQGPWVEEYQLTPWAGDYHFNVNIQQIYTLAFATNNPGHLMPLFDMLESEPFQTVMRRNAQRVFGIDDGLLLTHAVDDRGRQCGGISAGSVIDQACTGWTAQLYWLYYQYTLDRDFLRRRAVPFLRGALRSYQAMLKERDGRLSIPVSISAEYRFTDANGATINFGPDPSYQFACIHMLLDALIEAHAILGREPEPAWLDLKRRVPPYTLVERDGERRIAIWRDQDLDVCHRHHSYLACVYPFDSLGDWTPEHRRVLDDSVDHWIAKGMGLWSEWCYPWAAIIQARMGLTESPRVLLDIWRELFINEGLATVYLPRFRGLTAHRRADMLKPRESAEIMQLDGAMAGATALIEMLCFSRHGTVHIFPALSAKWANASFRNIRMPGAMLLSATRRNGRTETVTVESLSGGAIRLTAPDVKAFRVEGQDAELSLPVALEMTPGQKLTLRART